MAPRTCLVSLTDLRGTKHTVEVNADSLYEAAALGLSHLKKNAWVPKPGPATMLEVEVREPTVRHQVSVQQLTRWVDGASTSPNEQVTKQKLKAMLG
jgi:hypothetical protein